MPGLCHCVHGRCDHRERVIRGFRSLLICAALLSFACPLAAENAGPLEIVAPKRLPVGFAGEKLELSIAVRNVTKAPIHAELTSRLYQRSSGSLAPLEPAKPWWTGKIEPLGEINAPLHLVLPQIPGAAHLRVRIAGAAGTTANLPLIGIDRRWFADAVRALNKQFALHDPDGLVSGALEKAGVPVRPILDVADPATAPGAFIFIAARTQERENAVQRASAFARSRRPLLIFQEGEKARLAGPADNIARFDLDEALTLPDSAAAQYDLLVQLDRLLRAAPATASDPSRPHE
jgi:hypothetical protein